ncbi:putative capsid protein [Pacific flying fox faeces associated circular DNA virus-2]|uniref:Putative capsid protein n=1 Tax=Pacific flying fox faeces associated circular DNA virus-2 TaxID=1796011 RepID=A0A140CTV6_9VIRU|nr:putative capsid protein [Pacific flying fox faeces associated circular DNA virus-2]
MPGQLQRYRRGSLALGSAYRLAKAGWKAGRYLAQNINRGRSMSTLRRSSGTGGTSRRGTKRRRTSSGGRRGSYQMGSMKKMRGGFSGSRDGVSSFSTKRKRGTKRGWKKVLAPQVLRTVTSGRILRNDSGLQTVHEVLMTNAIPNAVNTTALMSGTTDLERLYQLLRVKDPNTEFGQAANATITRRFFVDSCRVKITFKNQTSIPVELTLYDITSRKDNTSALPRDTPPGNWLEGLTNENATFLREPKENGENSIFPGSKPFKSGKFWQLFNGRKSKTMVLGVGRKRLPLFNLDFHYIVTRREFSGFYQLRNVTQWCLAVLKGGIVSSGAAITGPAQVSSSYGIVDYTTEAVYKFKCMEKSTTVYQSFNALPAIAPAQQTSILEDTDLRAVLQTA